MASQNIARLGVVLGLDTAEFTAEIDKAISANGKLKDAIRRDTNSAAGELKNLIHATEDYGKALTRVELMQRETNSGRFMNATAEMKKRLLEQAAAYDKMAASAKNAAGAQFRMNEQQKIQLTYQTTDLVTQIASGQSPFIAILQQGGQLKDVMGGLGNMFRAVGSLFTPFSVGLTSVAVSVGAVSFALYKAIDDLQKFQDAMTLTGGFAGLTYDSLLNLGDVLSGKTNASIGSARDLMQQLAASGKYTTTSMEAVGEVILRFSKIAGVDAKKAAETLIPLLDGTASSAKQLNDKYHFLTLEQYKNIEALEKQGKLQESAKLQATLLNESLQSTQRQLGNLERAWEGVANFASKAWDAMMGWGRDSGTERAKELERLINKTTQTIDERKAAGFNTQLFEAELQKYRTELNAIVSKEMAALDAAEAKAKQVEENQKKIKAYAGAGGSTKSKEIQSAIDKAEAENKFRRAMQSANEIEKIELEAEKKIQEKRIEFGKKSSEEKRAFGGLLAKQEAAEILGIELEKEEKIRQVRTKNMLAQYRAEQELKDETNVANAAVEKMRDDVRIANQARTRSMEFSKEQLEMRNKMIFATEREQRLAQVSLEYARRRKEVEAQGGPDREFNLDQVERQEQMAKLFVQIEDSMMRTQRVFDSVWNNMGAAIDNFVKTGKLNMKDFARSVIADLLAMHMKMQAMTLLRGLFASFGGTASTYNASGGIAEHVFNPQARAMGGPVSAGSPYIVGERGPELFMPSGSGTIIPNNQMSMGSTTNVTNNYINAIDVKSFEDRLLGSSNTIWAANQYANKNLATNFGRT